MHNSYKCVLHNHLPLGVANNSPRVELLFPPRPAARLLQGRCLRLLDRRARRALRRRRPPSSAGLACKGRRRINQGAPLASPLLRSNCDAFTRRSAITWLHPPRWRYLWRRVLHLHAFISRPLLGCCRGRSRSCCWRSWTGDYLMQFRLLWISLLIALLVVLIVLIRLLPSTGLPSGFATSHLLPLPARSADSPGLRHHVLSTMSGWQGFSGGEYAHASLGVAFRAVASAPTLLPR